MRLFLCAVGILVGLALVASLPADASTTPPPSGDWTIGPGEDAVLELGGNTSQVQGNITVQGTLFVGNGTLELAPAACASPAELLLTPGASLRLEGAVLLASSPCTFVLRAEPGSAWVAANASLEGVGALSTAQVSGVGVLLRGASAQVSGLTLVDAAGGIGLQEGAALTGSDLSATVHGRAIYAAGGSTVALDNLTATGDGATTDYLVIVEGSTLSLTGGSLSVAPVALLTLSSTASFSDVDLGPVGDVGVITLSSSISWRGGTIAPYARAGFESYGSVLDLETSFYNVTIGTVLVESTLNLANSSFNASGANPKGSFAVVYARDSVATVADSVLSGLFWVSDVTRLINGTPTLVPVYGCGTSAVWSVRSQVAVYRTSTECFDTHYEMEDSVLTGQDLLITNGTEGIRMLRGSISVEGLNGTLFVSPAAALLTAFDAEGMISGVVSRGNTMAVEITASDLLIEGLDYTWPGLGVRVVSGSPTINGSTFAVHNSSGVEVQSGSPRITNSSFTLSANLLNATGVFVQGGSPTIENDEFVGVSARALTFGVWGWPDAAPTVRSSRFSGLDRAVVVYGQGFLLEGNSVDQCNQGFESREGSSGRIAGNTFSNLTVDNSVAGVRLYFAATIVEGNTFTHVKYGIQAITITTSLRGETRISGNHFSDVGWYAIEITNSTRPVVIDNNTATRSGRGAVELVNAPALGSYNLFFDFQGYGYTVTNAALTIVGDRLENLSTAIYALDSTLRVDYATLSRNAQGILSQDSPTSVHNSSFQSNSIAIELSHSGQNEVHDSLFLANGDSILVFNSTHADVRNSNFLRTLSFVVSCENNASANVTFTKRAEISGGTLRISGSLVSDAPFLRLAGLRFQFMPVVGGGVPGVVIRGAGELEADGLDLTNSTTPYIFRVEDSVGVISETHFAASRADPTGPPGAPTFVRSTVTIHNVGTSQSQAPLTFVSSDVQVDNLTARDTNASSIAVDGGSVLIRDAAILDGAGCGLTAIGGARVNATNVSIRGHPGGAVCGDNLTADFFLSDLGGGPPAVNLTGASEVGLWSSLLTDGWNVDGNATLTIGWRVGVTVELANPVLLPVVNVAVSDSLGHRTVSHPNATGVVVGLPYFPERTITESVTLAWGPYTVSATLDPLVDSESIPLDRDTLVQLSLEDTLAPTITITSPVDGAIARTATVTIAFSAVDRGTGIQELAFRFGAGTPVTVDPAVASHSFQRVLVDGTHTLTVMAQDYGGNRAEASVSFTIDTISPLISINTPRSLPFYTKDSTVLVQVGFDVDVVNVTIGGQEAVIFRNTANRTITIPEGTTTIEVRAVDRAGNEATTNLTVVSDRTPPALEVSNRQDSNVTIDSFVVLRGTSEPGSIVFVQGVPVETTNGSFEALVLLSVGKNTIEVRAQDALGNENVTSLTVTRGVVEPSSVLDTALSILGAVMLVAGVVLLVRTLRTEYVETERDRKIRRFHRGGKP